MATQAPDPYSFQAWEDAFQYPVPVVRRLEQQLRGNINENRNKLRTLVGASYRDLLGTADRIMGMDAEMQKTEALLGEMGQKCNARSIERVAANHGTLAAARRASTSARRTLASELALLQSCMTLASRMTKTGESCLLPARLLVLARLLHKSTSQSSEAPPILESLRTRIAGFRSRLLNAIDRQLADVTMSTADLVETLTAFSLVTSSTPTSVLRHFLHVRSSALSRLVETLSDAVIKTALDLVVLTVRQTQALFPKGVADALARLKDAALLDDPTIRSLPQLNLDVYQRWISADIRTFTPWPRHDELQPAQTVQILQPWTVATRESLKTGLRRYLSSIADAQRVSQTREESLRHLLVSFQGLGGLDKLGTLQDLQQCFLDRLQAIAAEHSLLIFTIYQSVLSGHDVQNPALQDLWSSAFGGMDLSRGAVSFRSQLQACAMGKDGRLQTLSRSLDKWQASSDAFLGVIKAMRNTRWNDEFDVEMDEDLDAESIQTMLSRVAPDSIASALRTETGKALARTVSLVQSMASNSDHPDESAARTGFLLRVLREITLRQSLVERPETSELETPLIISLHLRLAEHVVHRASARHSPQSQSLVSFDEPPTVALWEGSPALPVQPSLACFRCLHDICKAMKDVGSDLWTQPAKDQLKQLTQERIAEAAMDLGSTPAETAVDENPQTDTDTHEHTNGNAEEVLTNGDSQSPGSEAAAVAVASPVTERDQQQHKKVTQALYDLLYLERFLALSSSASLAAKTLSRTVDAVREKATMEEAEVERLRKSAVEYYKRTYLLFGLLASP